MITLMHQKFPGRWSKIKAFNFTARKRIPEFPENLIRYRTDHVPPAITVHSDYSRNGGRMAMSYSFPGQEAAFDNKDFELLNFILAFSNPFSNQPNISVWRPLNETDDWPRIVCDHNTVDHENDILSSDSLRRNLIVELSLLHYNEAHKWYFLENHGVDDLLVFRNVDSRGECAIQQQAKPLIPRPLSGLYVRSPFATMSLQKVTRVHNAQNSAMSFILCSGANHILWDQCRFIWDSLAIARDEKTNEKMAIFGVEGKLQTIEHEVLEFRLQHTFDYSRGGGYSLQASVSSDTRDYSESIFVKPDNLENADKEKEYFEEAIATLTNMFAKSSMEATLRSVLGS
ncbi:hypothetical protein NUW58_g1149 [Xylaria curta]|uniref:Uncharacterized protein n=1 Tax=Xylaria curta TaxID=42375 RepID=A0ACC1PLH6_9PEZI|nr:hypothetical protein NUW58_g1149 [Xylaria curta]